MRFENFARGTLTGVDGSTMTVSHQAPYRPLPSPPDGVAYATITDSLRSPSQVEVISYTSATTIGSSTLLEGVTRGVEGTDQIAWAIGAVVTQDLVAGNLRLLELQDLKPFLYVGADDTVLRKIDPDNGRLVWQNTDMNGRILCVAVSPDAALVAVGTDAGKLWLVDARTGSTVWNVPIDEADNVDQVFSIAFSYSGSIYVTGDGRLYLIDALDGSEIWKADTPPGLAGNVAQIFGVLNDDSVITNYSTGAIFIAKFSIDGDLLWQVDTGSMAGARAIVGVRGELVAGIAAEDARFDEWLAELWSVEPALLFGAGARCAGLDGNFYIATQTELYSVSPTGSSSLVATKEEAEKLLAVDMAGNAYYLVSNSNRVIRRRNPQGDLDWQQAVSLAAINAVSPAPIHVANVITPYSGGFRLTRPDFNALVEKPTAVGGFVLRATTEASSQRFPPDNHCLLYLDGDDLTVKFDDGSTETIASKP